LLFSFWKAADLIEEILKRESWERRKNRQNMIDNLPQVKKTSGQDQVGTGDSKLDS